MQDSNKIDQRDRWQAELKLDYQLKGTTLNRETKTKNITFIMSATQ